MIGLASAATFLSCTMTTTQPEMRQKLGKAQLVYDVGLPDDLAKSIEGGENPAMPIDLIGEPVRRRGWLVRVGADQTAAKVGVTLLQRSPTGELLAEAGTVTRAGDAYELQVTMKGSCKARREGNTP